MRWDIVHVNDRTAEWGDIMVCVRLLARLYALATKACFSCGVLFICSPQEQLLASVAAVDRMTWTITMTVSVVIITCSKSQLSSSRLRGAVFRCCSAVLCDTVLFLSKVMPSLPAAPGRPRHAAASKRLHPVCMGMCFI